MGAINGVVFDLGGVVIDWNPMYLYRKVFEGDEIKAANFLETICTNAWNGRQDAGRNLLVATNELVSLHPEWAREIRAYYGRWIEMIGEAIPGTYELMTELKAAGYRLFALSNWHCETFAKVRYSLPAFQMFEHIVLSGEHGLIKPDVRLYNVALNCYGMPAGELVFVDDRQENVEGAEKAGMRGLCFTTANKLRSDLIALGVPLAPAAA
ncbi:2-haloacid dehalogenase [Rhizomicrobium palustre]|uniref:2-haloacid dehalogenase n=1 Tax=Rhizomicrobium palustre TaxID=189966 RepID=A0A846N2Y5_9PROT|nr:HAD family phosphatase [Rhizomicrobium palustre]NIK90096.1 2-haloacid dehalogenase [Rhizomicrobium palustre]